MRRLLLVLVLLAALGGIALPLHAQAPPEHDGGIGSCTTDAGGYCTVGHSLGAVPTDIQVTPRSPIGGPDLAGTLSADQPTVTSFRVRALHGDGTVLASAPITFWYHVWARPAAAPTTTSLPTVSDKLVPAKGAWWGDYVSSNPADVAARETLSGRKFDIVKWYQDWDSTFPSAAQKALADGGRFLSFDLETRDFQNAANNKCWSAVANGSQDANIDRIAAGIRAFGKPMFLGLSGEPEGKDGTACDAPHGVYGTAADFVAAWRHLHERFAADGVTNVVWVENYGNPSATTANAFYVGDAFTDWIGWDPYNWYNCRGHSDAWIQLADKMGGFYSWAQANHPSKPLGLTEYGSQQPSTATPSKGAWLRTAAADLSVRRPAVRAFIYFDRQDSDCAWRVDSSPDATQGWRDMGAAPYFNQPHA